MTSLGAAAFHRRLCSSLAQYLQIQYFGRTPLLQKALKDSLDQEGNLFRAPFIESAPGYLQNSRGFDDIEMPDWLHHFFSEMAEAGLGVYKTPYEHQLQALRAALKEKDLLVSTGTGSGKTECFLWPLMAKLVSEARKNPEEWNQHGIRTIILYPMNALVSDQLSRLRRLLGDEQNHFAEIFRNAAGVKSRRPTFGMYTGRTPYPGSKTDRKQDKALAQTLECLLPEESEETGRNAYLSRLKQQGRIPAKKDLRAFIRGLEKHEHLTDPEDAELITRFEMQIQPPDILITNYSMLEYMMLRKREAGIWDQTKRRLERHPEEKLLFVIDEAHMYRGAAGGEVALLIRRLMELLNIGRDRVQFILTTASLPGKTEAVKTFASELTSQKNTESFVFIQGQKKDLDFPAKPLDIPFERYLQFDLEKFDASEDDQDEVLSALFSEIAAPVPQTHDEWKLWLFRYLPGIPAFFRLMKTCRGQAVSVSDLCKTVFPEQPTKEAEKALEVLIAVAALGREKGTPLFPARMHMFFRGLKGVWACTNPDCSKGIHGDGIALGRVMTDDGYRTCPSCGHTVYELSHDRRCGALFFRGYIFRDQHSREYFWPYADTLSQEEMHQADLYIPPEGWVDSSGTQKPCRLNTVTGELRFDDGDDDEKNWRKLYIGTKVIPNGRKLIFAECPHCRKKISEKNLLDFGTRGDPSFNALVRNQFLLQPPADLSLDKERFPNQGRKVLLFSDSRQKAARLAYDQSVSAGSLACRQLAGFVLQEYAEHEESESEAWHSMKSFYSLFAKHAFRQNVRLFKNSTLFEDGEREDGRESARDRIRRRRSGGTYSPSEEDCRHQEYQEAVLRLFCSPYNSLFSTAVMWFEASDEVLDNAESEGLIAENGGVFATEDEFNRFYAIWTADALIHHCALDQNIPIETRTVAFDLHGTPGIQPKELFSENIEKCMRWSAADRERTRAFLLKHCLKKPDESAGETRFVPYTALTPRFDRNWQWTRCNCCGSILPFDLNGKCPDCGAGDLSLLSEEEMHVFDFWREPIFRALDGNDHVMNIDTEEHTAQLSHKDQRDSLWSKTENYEMRFQNLISGDETPVDILSCTTTMEVGIDIGSLVAVGLRNMPPTRENYQQRAGRAGRRGSSLSTILTYCQGGPHDSYYFRHPEEIVSGDPREPWVDVKNKKLIGRHLSLLAMKAFCASKDSDLEAMKAEECFEKETGCYPELRQFIEQYDFSVHSVPSSEECLNLEIFRLSLLKQLDELKNQYVLHPDQYAGDTLLDALYRAGIVPSYSFPKDVVSFYVQDFSDGKPRTVYQLERNLDTAISEYAPGRTLVIDKKNYQAGGFFIPARGFRPDQKRSAQTYLNDHHYKREISECRDCSWFGPKDDAEGEGKEKICPFCGGHNVHERKPMLIPWGFAPVNGKSSRSVPDDDYSRAEMPLYNTQPDSEEEMNVVWPNGHARTAFRTDQQILVENRGPGKDGYLVCLECGAATPEKKFPPSMLTPFPGGNGCKHPRTRRYDIGCQFRTDMFVIEIELDPLQVAVQREQNPWLRRACQSLSEALRLAASRLLDVDFSELNTGFRLRMQQGKVCADLYIYDSLSSGAGYSVALKDRVKELFDETLELLQDCSCTSSCHNCLRHFRNQNLQGMLDRFSAADLLHWARGEGVPKEISGQDQWNLIQPLEDILKQKNWLLQFRDGVISLSDGVRTKTVSVVPAMWVEHRESGRVTVNAGFLRFAKPLAFRQIEQQL